MLLTYAFTFGSRTSGNCCSACAADCAPICASSLVEKRLNPGLILVCASAMPAINATAIASETNLVRFIPGLLTQAFARSVPASHGPDPRLADADERGQVILVDQAVPVDVAAPARRERAVLRVRERLAAAVGELVLERVEVGGVDFAVRVAVAAPRGGRGGGAAGWARSTWPSALQPPRGGTVS